MSVSSLRVVSMLVLGLSLGGTTSTAKAYFPTTCDPEPDCFEVCYYNNRGNLVCNVTCDYGLPCEEEGGDEEGGPGGSGSIEASCVTDPFSGEVICPLEG